ncbi:hypothetical protein [Vulgatibacter incomptus]|uniref:Zinc-regulated TonB-dependent outer membrane receptor n=1 Tax=Vulgatibacter incomptus TaxID=1391653 RepID=A0A0K1PD62_9BACT|nr:hypothetical protein [Vulgatibacter incomptus]AKU91483.1 Zinc-regulated TonB-dependent outer membrane receptor [Vulgatibacter incomptus]
MSSRNPAGGLRLLARGLRTGHHTACVTLSLLVPGALCASLPFSAFAQEAPVAAPEPDRSQAAAPSAAGQAPSAPAPASSPDEDAERARLEAELSAELGTTQGPPTVPIPNPEHLQTPSAQPVGKLLPDISAIGTFAAAGFSGEPTLRLPAHEPTHRGPQLQEIELAFQSNIDPFVRADVFLAISSEGLEVEEAYATTLGLPWNLQLRAGQFYAPFGRFNQVHFLEVTPFADMPLPNRRFFGGEQLRGIGAEASVLLPLPFLVELRTAAISAGNEVSFGVPAPEIQRVTDLIGVARLLTSFELTDDLTLVAGASAANGPNSTGGPLVTDKNRTDIWGGDLYLRLRDRSSRAYTALQAEYLYRRATAPDGRVEQGGAYAWLVRRFDAEWEAAVRYDFLGLPGGRELGSPELGGEIGPFLEPARQQRVGAAVSYYPSEFQRIRVQANYDFGLETPGEPAKGVQEYFLQYQLVMGAHGAHPF